MAKKSFKNNPALQFITVNEEAESTPAPATEKPAAPKAAPQMPETATQKPPREVKPAAAIEPATPPTEPGAGEGTAPRPAEPPQAVEVAAPMPPPAPEPAPAQPVPMKLNPMYIETRSKRVQLLMQPTLHARLRQLASQRGQSLNDFVHEVLEKAAEGNGVG